MKPIESKSLSRNAMILACIIGAVSLITNIPFLRLPHELYLTIRYIFPHEVFGNISRLLLIPLRSPFLAGFPWFSFVLAGFLFWGAKQLQQYNKTIILKLCYFFLIVSILISIPGNIQMYFFALNQYNKYIESAPTQKSGILGLIDSFVMARKPSLTLLILQLVILLGYAGWSGFQIRQLYRFDKRSLEADADAIS